MRRTIWAIAVGAIMAATLASGCDDDCTTGCEKFRECNDSVDVNECIDECDDGLNDGRFSESQVGRCADCVDSNTCGEIATGDCNEACADLLR